MGTITGEEKCKGKELAKLLDTALFTVLTPQARQNAEAKALKDAASKKLYVNYGDDPTAFLKEKYGFCL